MLNGASAMEGDMDVGGNKVENVALLNRWVVATNKNYVDDNTAVLHN